MVIQLIAWWEDLTWCSNASFLEEAKSTIRLWISQCAIMYGNLFLRPNDLHEQVKTRSTGRGMTVNIDHHEWQYLAKKHWRWMTCSYRTMKMALHQCFSNRLLLNQKGTPQVHWFGLSNLPLRKIMPRKNDADRESPLGAMFQLELTSFPRRTRSTFSFFAIAAINFDTAKGWSVS